MHRIFALVLWAGLAALPAQAADTPAASDPVFAKISPDLRMRLAVKTAAPMRALAHLRRPLPPEALGGLEAAGLTVFSVSSDALNVEGDAEAMLRLAARDEVVRLGLSSGLEPSGSRRP